MKVIGISGQKRQGKDVAANHLVEKMYKPKFISDFGDPIGNIWKRVAFADSLKEVLTRYFGANYDFIEEWKVKEEIPEGFDMAIRNSMKLIGETFRKIKGSVWIDLVYQRDNNIVVSDVRYINELQSVKDHDGLNILLWRPGYENDDPHDSEAQLKPLVDWYTSTGMEGNVFQELLKMYGDEKNIVSDFPANKELLDKIKLVDFFIKNDGDKEDLYEKLDKFIVSRF